MRLFAALRISEETGANLFRWASRIKMNLQNPAFFQWVSPQNYHLTLKFFGEVGENRLPVLESALEKASLGRREFFLHMRGTGYFPNADRPRVYWAGVAPSAELSELAAAVETETIAAGFTPSDKPFSAHLTLARLEPGSAQEFLKAAASGSSTPFGTFSVSGIVLMQSQPSPQGPVYSALTECRF